MAKKNRDYKREYQTAIARGENERYKVVHAKLNLEEKEKLDKLLKDNNCQTLGEFIRKLIR